MDLRVQVMKLPALLALAGEVRATGCNTLVVEWEASFPYRRNATLSHAFAYTPKEVARFLAHCRGLGLNVIPLQQSLGHLEYVLRHPRYAELREDSGNLCQLCPQRREGARLLLRSLLADLREHHDGPFIHLGGDEAYLLGHCPECRAYVQRHGYSRLYAEHMRMVIEEAAVFGWRSVIWADMLLKHPECARILPKSTVLIDWNYGWARDRFGAPDQLLDLGYEVWGAAALRSAPDNHSLTWWARHLRNFREFIPQAAKDGYRGMVLTSWSTSGLYGYERDGAEGGEVLDLLPIRRVYPLNGHRILLAAFSAALEASGEINPDEFLAAYAAQRFGLGPQGRRVFARALLEQSPQNLVPVARLARLRPRRNRDEFAHLRLIEAFRSLQCEIQGLAARFNAPGYSRRDAGRLLPRAASMTRRSAVMHSIFRRLQRDYIHPEEIEQERAYREKLLLRLLQALKNQAGQPHGRG